MNSLFAVIIVNILINFVLSETCPKDTPVFKEGKCQEIYCSKTEYKNGTCIISNPIMEIQWLNDIFINYYGNNVDSFSLVKMKNNDIITITCDSYNSTKIYVDKYSSSDNIPFKSGTWKPMATESQFVGLNGVILKIDNIEYILMCGVVECLLIDFDNGEIYIKSILELTGFSFSNLRSNSYYFKLINLNNENKILYNVIINGVIRFSIVNFITKELEYNIESIIDEDNLVNTENNDQLNCFITKRGYIECLFYTKIDDNLEVKIAIYNQTLNLLGILLLDSQKYTNSETDLYINFNDCFLLKEEIGVYAYYLWNEKKSKPQLFLQINELINNGSNFEFNKFELAEKIEINYDEEALYNANNFYFSQAEFLMKINDNKFSYIYHYSDSKDNVGYKKYMVLIVIEIYNNKNLILRYYKINFNLYDIDINNVSILKSFLLNSNIGISFIPTFLEKDIDKDIEMLVGINQISVIFGFMQYEEDNKEIILDVYQNYEFKICNYLFQYHQ